MFGQCAGFSSRWAILWDARILWVYGRICFLPIVNGGAEMKAVWLGMFGEMGTWLIQLRIAGNLASAIIYKKAVFDRIMKVSFCICWFFCFFIPQAQSRIVGYYQSDILWTGDYSGSPAVIWHDPYQACDYLLTQEKKIISSLTPITTKVF
ncbi:MAG: hypothetical protein CTY16_12455 [Methylobacter sp.]|nr:MAG: hypothetical protein CTY16_12455 [Methylobacter sp.]